MEAIGLYADGSDTDLARAARQAWLELDKFKTLVVAVENLLAHHRVAALPETDTLTPRMHAVRAAIS